MLSVQGEAATWALLRAQALFASALQVILVLDGTTGLNMMNQVQHMAPFVSLHAILIARGPLGLI